MANVFLYSDPHFGHAGVCSFMRLDGITKLRPFDTAEEMDEVLVDNWNNIVTTKDKTYILGDVAINKKALKILHRLNGDKVLIKGNHDIYKLSDYTPYFRDIRAYHVLSGMILSHIPIHPDSLGRFGCQIHGHLHEKRVRLARGFDHKTGNILYGDEIDPRYYNVSVEQIDYTPISLETVKRNIVDQGGTIEMRNGNGPVM